jgi:hypothetical protein
VIFFVFSGLRREVVVCFVGVFVVILFVFSGLRREVVVCFVGVFVDHQCLNFLFISNQTDPKIPFLSYSVL